MHHEEEQIQELTSKTWDRIQWVLFIGIFLVVILSFFKPNTPVGNGGIVVGVISTIGCGLLLAGASLAAGGFMGFIFGIPSLLQNQNLTASRPTTFKYNDNLVQISDWLTKIIVGVGLTQLNNIPRKVIRLGDLLQDNFGGGPWGRNSSLAIIFYFLLFGFLIIYFWTRTDFTSIMKKTDDDINQVKEENEKIKQENENIKDKLVETRTKENIEKSDLASDSNTLHTIEGKTPSDEFEKLKQNVQNALKNKPVTVTEDLQKGRWGGKAADKGKILKATVTPNAWQSFFDVAIEVSMANGAPLNLPVALFVHDSYRLPDNVIYLKPDANGVVKQTLIAYEAFTIGALLPDETELELDLNDQPGYPKEFYWKKVI